MGGAIALRPFAELAGLSILDVSKLALALLPGHAGEPLRRLTACTDGSFDPRSGVATGAAVFVGLTVQSKLAKLGWAAVEVRHTPGAVALADRPTNNSAELAAILLALRGFSGLRAGAEFEIMSDS
eukprot:5768572-Alexandrium_andersonii.AAC.1